MTPIAVNGWQQGWVVPAGDPGTITLTFASNSLYRAGLAVGLALLPLLALLAFWRTRAGVPTTRPRSHGAPGRWAAVAGAGRGGGDRRCRRRRGDGRRPGPAVRAAPAALWSDGVPVGLSAGGLILAGAALSRQPWRSVDGYAGHSANVQLLALISLAVLAASVVTMPDRARGPRDE